MKRMELVYRWVGVGIFLLTLGVYWRTMGPTTAFWDCGERIACAYIMGVPHPPGTPLYILLGRFFTLAPLGSVAQRVNFMSALSGALAAWCIYLSSVALGRRALGGRPLALLGDGRDVAVIVGSAVAALSLAFSYTQWFNATEAETYSASLLFTSLGVWLLLYWEGTRHGVDNDYWLYGVTYLFGLGGGLHLLCLLTIPSLLLLVWFADQRLRRLILLVLGLGVWTVGVAAGVGLGLAGYGLVGVGLAGGVGYLWRCDRRAAYLLAGGVGLFALGYSTYLTLYLRSALGPAIDQNNPETWEAFVKFINREQYGTESMLLTMFEARASRAYQFWHLQMKYFLQQFPFPLLERLVVFRKATEPVADPVWISLVPYVLGLGGIVWHGRRDWRRFVALAVMFGVMGFGLSMYLNMPDPQPRERHYVFVGMYYTFALWMGLGWTGLVEWLRGRLRLRGALLVGVAVVGLMLPAGIAARLYRMRDRSGDYIAYDYAYNLLQSCAPNGILFTNGDNDTFPLWFLQEVKGIRRDVRVANLSLLNTNWYIKQLRDREPRIDIPLTDTYIDSVLTDPELVNLYRRLWREPRTPVEFKRLGLDVEVHAQPGHDLLRVQDVMVIGIIAWNAWERPIYFAITIPANNRLNLDPYLRMEGMVMRLVPERDLGADSERLADNIFNVYQFRGVADPAVYKDENAIRLLSNYRAIVLQLADLYQRQDRQEEMVELMRWAEEYTIFGWEGYYSGAGYLEAVDRLDLAGEFIEKATRQLIVEYGRHEVATYGNIIALASVLLNEPYSQYDRAERLYRQAIALEPQNWRAYYELAATLQARGDLPGALAVLVDYRQRYGVQENLREAEQLLQHELQKGSRQEVEDPLPTPSEP